MKTSLNIYQIFSDKKERAGVDLGGSLALRFHDPKRLRTFFV